MEKRENKETEQNENYNFIRGLAKHNFSNLFSSNLQFFHAYYQMADQQISDMSSEI